MGQIHTRGPLTFPLCVAQSREVAPTCGPNRAAALSCSRLTGSRARASAHLLPCGPPRLCLTPRPHRADAEPLFISFARMGRHAPVAAESTRGPSPSLVYRLPKLVGPGVSTPSVLLARAWTGIRA